MAVRTLLGSVMLANAALFVFGSLQHAGVAFGALSEPRIIPAAIVEGLCALALGCGGRAVFGGGLGGWRAALTGNLVALSGVVLGIVALALGAGPRTASNDLYHRIMLGLIAASLLLLFTRSGRVALRRN